MLIEKLPIRYIPSQLTVKDKERQLKALRKSRKLYKDHKYFTRPRFASFKNTPSKHVQRAKAIYGVEHISPSAQLAKATGCSISSLRKIVNKGEGAYYSSGSRPNQTAQSWGLARLASSITAGKSASVDFNIIDRGCDHRKGAYQMAKRSRKRFGHGQSHTRRIEI